MLKRLKTISLYLKDHSEVASEYTDLKMKIANKYRNDKKYIKEKNKFITKIENDACNWYQSKNIHVV